MTPCTSRSLLQISGDQDLYCVGLRRQLKFIYKTLWPSIYSKCMNRITHVTCIFLSSGYHVTSKCWYLGEVIQNESVVFSLWRHADVPSWRHCLPCGQDFASSWRGWRVEHYFIWNINLSHKSVMKDQPVVQSNPVISRAVNSRKPVSRACPLDPKF